MCLFNEAIKRLEAEAEAHLTTLQQQIINIPCKPKGYEKSADWCSAYAFGHRDARHAAAELVLNNVQDTNTK